MGKVWLLFLLVFPYVNLHAAQNKAQNAPRVVDYGDFYTVSNFNWKKMSVHEKELFRCAFVRAGICNSIDDILFLPGKTTLIKPKQSCEACLVARSVRGQDEDQVRIDTCRRRCSTVEKTACVVCGALASKGVKGIAAAAACTAIVEILAYKCSDCCYEGFDQCAKELEAMLHDLSSTGFPDTFD